MCSASYYAICPLTTGCVLLLQNVFSYYRMCSLTTECVLLLQNVFSYYRIGSLTIECALPLRRRNLGRIFDDGQNFAQVFQPLCPRRKEQVRILCLYCSICVDIQCLLRTFVCVYTARVLGSACTYSACFRICLYGNSFRIFVCKEPFFFFVGVLHAAEEL